MAKSQTTEIRAEAGFSLIELIMALIVLAFGVVGLATTTIFVTRQLTLAEVTTARASAIQTVMEGIRAMPYDSIDNGGGGDDRGAGGLLDGDHDERPDQGHTVSVRGPGYGPPLGKQPDPVERGR